MKQKRLNQNGLPCLPRLRDADNAATPELYSYQQAISYPAAVPALLSSGQSNVPLSDVAIGTPPPVLPNPKHKNAGTSRLDFSSNEQDEPSGRGQSRLSKGGRRVRTDAQRSTQRVNTDTVPDSTLPLDEIDKDSHLRDIDVLEIGGPTTDARENRARDVDNFFTPTYTDNRKKSRNFKKWSRSSHVVSFAAEISALRLHVQAHHKAEYLQWAKENGFVSILPSDCKERNDKMRSNKQSQLDSHLQPVPIYSEELFREAAIRWLIDTNQPLAALTYPSFKNMIEITSRATNGIVLPSGKATCRAIINAFNQTTME